MPRADQRNDRTAAATHAVPHVLREYALLADGERGALIGPRGDLVWLCFPQWHDDAVFAALIGGGGSYSIAPAERFVWGGYYERGTLIWRSRWVTSSALVESREALAYPGDPGRIVVLRRLSVLRSSVELEVSLELCDAFGHERVQGLHQDDDGNWRARAGRVNAAWMGASEFEPIERRGEGASVGGRVRLSEGQQHDFVLVLGPGEEIEVPDPDVAWEATEAAWHERVPRFDETLAPRDTRHAYAVLSGLTSRSGGMVAAATMSLPERAREGRSYDYRYAWIRDQCYVGQAVASAGPHALLDEAIMFVRDRLLEHGQDLSPAYTVTAAEVPEERSLELPGYPGGTDVVGNRVRDQFQLDVFGEALLLFAAAGRLDRLDADAWRAVELAAQAIESRRNDQEAGIWELEPAVWTHSQLICSAGLRAVSKLPEAGRHAGDWVSLADKLVADIGGRALRADGAWQRGPDDQRLDASLLLAAIRGALAPEDPRSVTTLQAIERELSQDGYLYRYRADERPLGDAEGAFLLCGFMLALAHHQQGHRVEAARWFERNRAACGPPGLLSEEFDVLQRQLRGNLPQAFVHALLLECSVTMAR